MVENSSGILPWCLCTDNYCYTTHCHGTPLSVALPSPRNTYAITYRNVYQRDNVSANSTLPFRSHRLIKAIVANAMRLYSSSTTSNCPNTPLHTHLFRPRRHLPSVCFWLFSSTALSTVGLSRLFTTVYACGINVRLLCASSLPNWPRWHFSLQGFDKARNYTFTWLALRFALCIALLYLRAEVMNNWREIPIHCEFKHLKSQRRIYVCI